MKRKELEKLAQKIAKAESIIQSSSDTKEISKAQQEIMELYKKNNVRPFAAFEQILITLPIFLIVYRVVTILRPLKGAVLFNI